MHRNSRGFSAPKLILLVAGVILVVLAIYVWVVSTRNKLKMADNENKAILSLRDITKAQIQYGSEFPAIGFACSLSALGPNAADTNPAASSAGAANLLQGDLPTGIKDGYTFSIVNCTHADNSERITGYQVTAVPISVGKTGNRGYCTDSDGVIKTDTAGGANCTQPLQ